MNTQIQLTKIPHSKLKVFTEVISKYTLSFNPEELTDIDKCYISIAHTFFDTKVKRELLNRFPSKTHTIKFLYHEAFIIVKAFLVYQNITSIQEYNYSVVEAFKIDLYKQLL